MSDLEELARRCEQATGPDRRLDAEIDIAVRGFPTKAFNQANGMRPKGSPDLDRIEWFIKWGAARYTASIDAALTLVPEGWNYIVRWSAKHRTAQAYCEFVPMAPFAPEELLTRHSGKCTAPALAICAAALRARSA